MIAGSCDLEISRSRLVEVALPSQKSPGAAVVAAAGLSAVAAAQRWEVVLRLLEEKVVH